MTQSDLEGLKDIIRQQIAFKKDTTGHFDQNESLSNAIDYTSYRVFQREDLRNLLGQFTFRIDDNGDVIIKDTYDFNKKFSKSKDTQWGMIKQALSDPEGLAKSIAYKVLPEEKGGVSVKINLGKI